MTVVLSEEEKWLLSWYKWSELRVVIFNESLILIRDVELLSFCISGWFDCKSGAEVPARDRHDPVHHRAPRWQSSRPALPHRHKHRAQRHIPEPTLHWEPGLHRPNLPGANLLKRCRVHVRRHWSVRISVNDWHCSSNWSGVTMFIGSTVLWTSVQEYVDCDFTFVWNITC